MAAENCRTASATPAPFATPKYSSASLATNSSGAGRLGFATKRPMAAVFSEKLLPKFQVASMPWRPSASTPHSFS
ncbi:MAG: hypothetical protein BWY76_03469 [bacterium ADurb.Bin429]|nr:MAG: hypothetical protein BWY76_03469 [bacterium ADurb.Bin429]